MLASTIRVRINSKIFNDEYLPYLHNDKRYEIFYGGAGSGKSHFVAQKKVYQHLKEKGHKTLVVRKVARSNRHSTFDLIKNIIYSWRLSNLFKIKENDMEIKCVNGNHMIFTGLDDVEKLKSITGITDMWIEETTEITEKDFNQLDLRLRGKSNFPKQITMTFNPILSSHWLKKHFFDRKVDSCSILMTTYKDNKFIDEEYKQVIEGLKEQDKTFYEVYALGHWGTLTNVIYSNWDVVQNVPEGDTFYGIDFGFNHPTALIKVIEYDGEMYLTEVLYQTHLTNSDLIDRMKGFGIGNAPIYCDSAEPNRVEELARAGFNVFKAKKEVKDGIDLIKRKKLHVLGDSINLIDELRTYKWKEKQSGEILDEPVKFHDDAVDAVRYALFTHSLVQRVHKGKRRQGRARIIKGRQP